MTAVIVRVLVLAVAVGAGLALGPVLGVPMPSPWLAGAGLLVGILAVLLEWRARRVPVERLFWGATGAAIGVVLGLGLGSAVGAVVPGAATLGRGLFGLLVGYLGWSVALAKGDELAGLSTKLFPKAASQKRPYKILDTSVIIDGRVADVCESGFLEGTLVVPQFVLREIQQIADSPDGLKRNRGKRGFDVIQRLQRIPKVTVLIHDGDFPQVREVDRKLIELRPSFPSLCPCPSPSRTAARRNPAPARPDGPRRCW
ncbi:MAG: hypothetical protein HY953_09545, partial [Candidatus Rokubacteria bacterium]|nr:hypothetical protein [Candidatus Rokubacteria bacterium]